MSETSPQNTRVRILEAARDLFAARGYQRTSVREIAERLGLTKTAVLYHFPAKADILAALAEPLIRDLEAVTATATIAPAGPPGPPDMRGRVVEGLLEVYIAHRHSLRLVLRDIALFAQEPVFYRFVAVMQEANRLVAGPDPSLGERVRAAQAIAMLSDPVIILADMPAEPLRREVLEGVRLLLAGRPADPPSAAGTVPAPGPGSGPAPGPAPGSGGGDDLAPRRRGGGRPGAMSPEMVETARRMYAGGSRTVAEIAADLGVSRATVYRYLAPQGPPQ
ncbi:TetR family transcriptional regulator [Streptosporangium sp. NPDC051023]|uniref:TetR family transcriptional regulator n=1 Tax=Streptosporangium sp. NPDC051023 TaxID=3155410 RepID=UPI00344CA299